ncbi:MAG TPA: glycosyltransferase 87 family protein [Solirubrobacteraceae bacterium]|nr:glycosyltransferase 87 family protein [Solirubrobacteraceae bacterium]
MRRTLLALLSLAVLACAIGPATASAATGKAPIDVEPPIYKATNLDKVPFGFTITPRRALAIAETAPKLDAIHRTHHPLRWVVDVWGVNHYEIYFTFHGKLIADQIIGAHGELGPTYTGALMLGIYARGQYGQVFDSPWVLVPFTLMFLLPILLLRRCSWLTRVDIAAVLLFFVSYWRFDTTHLESSVWLFYPPLLYLLVRMLIRGFRPRSFTRKIDVRLPTVLMAIGLVALVAGRIVVTFLPANVLDVGTASALGAHRILLGQPIYYPTLGHPDTYGPLAYLAYVPFLALSSHLSWAYLLPVREATIAFDVLTIAGLVWFGVRLRGGRDGWRLGLLLAWLWAACPFTVLGMEKSTNDGLVALIVVLAMLVMTSPIKRGIVVGLGAASKFFPAVLLPLVAIGPGTEPRSAIRKVLAGFVIATGASFAVFMPPGGLQEVWNHTIGYQLTRSDIFSIWALHPALAPLKDVVELGAVLLAVAVAFRPRGPRSLVQIAALGAAVIIAVQLPAMHWFYMYIPWFLPLVLIAVLATDPADMNVSPEDEAAHSLEQADTAPVLAATA